MPNWCENQLHFGCSEEEFEEKIMPLLKGRDPNGEERELTFQTTYRPSSTVNIRMAQLTQLPHTMTS